METEIDNYKEDREGDSRFRAFINIIIAKLAIGISKRETLKILRLLRRLELNFIYGRINNRNDID